MPDEREKPQADHASRESNPSPEELLWRQYSLHYDVYKFHFDACLKYSTLLFTVTGALLGYYFKELQGRPSSRWVLFPAIVMNVLLGIGCFVGGSMVGPRKREVDEIAKRFGFSSPPNLTLLQVVLWLMCLVNAVTAVGLGILIFT